MRGYYVIPLNEDIIEFTGKNARKRAIKKAKELILKGDQETFIEQFNDDYDGGFLSEGEIITPDQIMKENI